MRREYAFDVRGRENSRVFGRKTYGECAALITCWLAVCRGDRRRNRQREFRRTRAEKKGFTASEWDGGTGWGVDGLGVKIVIEGRAWADVGESEAWEQFTPPAAGTDQQHGVGLSVVFLSTHNIRLRKLANLMFYFGDRGKESVACLRAVFTPKTCFYLTSGDIYSICPLRIYMLQTLCINHSYL